MQFLRLMPGEGNSEVILFSKGICSKRRKCSFRGLRQTLAHSGNTGVGVVIRFLSMIFALCCHLPACAGGCQDLC